MKQNDYLLNRISNPEFNNLDFSLVGLNTENTSLESRDTYKNLDYIKSNPMFQTDGKFDELKFDNFYDETNIGYNQMSMLNTSEAIGKSFKHYKNDIFAPLEQRNIELEWQITKTATNPDRQLVSAWGSNSRSNPTSSSREIAQSLLVWDTEEKKWTDSPNSSGFLPNNFFNTLVLATYDEDGQHINPITGQVENHKKGERKINENGTYYYETLGNRDIYGKEVLSNFDVITEDGSAWNKYDFFDSDDLEKSVTGSITRNIMKIAPVFMGGYVAPIYIGARVALATSDLFAKLGKMAFGSDIQALSAIEGFNKSMTFSSSDYALQHPWSVENILNMAGDVFTLLAELRWLFEYAPAMFGKTTLNTAEKRNAFTEQFKNMKLADLKKLADEAKLSADQILKRQVDWQASALSEANHALEQAMKSGYKLGEKLSKAYMTGITVAESYGEAKREGATDLEAALFTLGYAMGEYGILNTLLGEWILPELRVLQLRFKQTIRALHGILPEANASTLAKRSWMGKFFLFGRDWWNGDMVNGTGKRMALHMLSNAIGEGVEEVSEEALQDFSKSIFNGVEYLIGRDVYLSPTWRDRDGKLNLQNTASDYLLNFVGGFIGGGIGNLMPTYREATKIGLIKSTDLAYQELLYYIREGYANDIKKIASGMSFASTELSFEILDGHFKSADKNNSLNTILIDNFNKFVDKLEQICNIERDIKSEDGIKKDLVLKDVRFLHLLSSKTLPIYLLSYHTAVANLVSDIRLADAIRNNKASDSSKLTELQERELSDLELKIAEDREELLKYTDGTMAKSFILDSFFEMENLLSEGYLPNTLTQYIRINELKKGHSGNLSDVSLEDIEAYKQSWILNQLYDFKDQIHERRLLFDHINQKMSLHLKTHLQEYFTGIYGPTELYEGSLFGEDMEDPGIINKVLERIRLDLADPVLDLFFSIQAKGTKDINESRRIVLASIFRSLAESNNDIAEWTDILTMRSKDLLNEAYNNTELFNRLLNIALVDANERERNAVLSYDKSALIDYLFNKYTSLLNRYINNLFEYNSDLFVNFIKDTPFMKSSTRLYLKDFVNQYVTNADKKLKYIEAIDSVKYSPIQELLDKEQLVLNDKGITFSNLVELLEKEVYLQSQKGTLEDYGYSETYAEAIDNAIKLIDILESHLAAGRTDGIDYFNPFGYNLTVNEFYKDLDLITYDVNTYNVLALDLDKMRQELYLYKSIVERNTGLMLALQPKIANERMFRIIESLHKLMPKDVNIDDWDGYEELLNDIEQAENIISSLYEVTGLFNDDNIQQMKKALHILFNSIYKFFNNENNKNKTKEEFAEFLFNVNSEFLLPEYWNPDADYFETIENQNNKINLKTLFSFLISAGSISYDSFEKVYSNIINLEESFVHNEGLSNLLFNEVANVTQTDLKLKMLYVYDKYSDTFIKSGVMDLGRPDYLVVSTSKRNNNAFINYDRCFLAEGIAGTGKSSSNITLLIKILNQIDPNLVSKIFIVHRTLKDAESMMKSIVGNTGLSEDNFVCYSHDEYIKYISNNIPDMELIGGEFGYSKHVINELLYLDEETDRWHFKEESKNLAKGDNVPSLVIIDEATNMTELAMSLHNKFMLDNDRQSVILGDFNQTTIRAKMSTDTRIERLSTHRNNFLSTFALSLSFRTDNKVNILSLKDILDKNRKLISAIKDNNGAVNVMSGEETVSDLLYEFKYAQNDRGLYGIKIDSSLDNIEKSERVITEDSDIAKTISLMLSTLNKGEFITYIYNDKDSVVYKYLESLNVGSKILFVEKSALGREGKYYIVEDNDIELMSEEDPMAGNMNIQALIEHTRNLYTNLSRAKQATFIIANRDSDVAGMDSINDEGQAIRTRAFKLLPESSKEELNIGKFTITKLAIIKYNKKITAVILLLLGDIENIADIVVEYTIQANKPDSDVKLSDKDDKTLIAEANNLLKQDVGDDIINNYIKELNKRAQTTEIRDIISLLESKLKEKQNSVEVEDDEESLDKGNEINQYSNIGEGSEGKLKGNLYSFNAYLHGLEYDNGMYYFEQSDDVVQAFRQMLDDIDNNTPVDYAKHLQFLAQKKIPIIGIRGMILSGLYHFSLKEHVKIDGNRIVIDNDFIDNLFEDHNRLLYQLKYGTENSINEEIKKVFFLEQEGLKLNARIAFKSFSTANKFFGLSRAIQKVLNVTGLRNIATDDKRLNVRNHQIVALIGLENDTQSNFYSGIEIPLFTYPSPFALLDSFGLKETWNNYKKNKKNKDLKLVEFIEYCREAGIEVPLMFVTISKIFMASNNYIHYFKKDGKYIVSLSDSMSDNTTNTGIFVISKDKGESHEFDREDYFYVNEEEFLHDMVNSRSNLYAKKQAYALDEDLIVDGKVLIKKGAHFIFMSENPDINTMSFEDLINKYIEELKVNKNHTIRICKINAPSVNPEKFLGFIIRKAYDRNNAGAQIGNRTSLFKLLSYLINDDKFVLDYLNRFGDIYNAAFNSDRFDALKKLINQINLIASNVSNGYSLAKILSSKWIDLYNSNTDLFKTLIESSKYGDLSIIKAPIRNRYFENVSLGNILRTELFNLLFKGYIVDILENTSKISRADFDSKVKPFLFNYILNAFQSGLKIYYPINTNVIDSNSDIHNLVVDSNDLTYRVLAVTFDNESGKVYLSDVDSTEDNDGEIKISGKLIQDSITGDITMFVDFAESLLPTYSDRTGGYEINDSDDILATSDYFGLKQPESPNNILKYIEDKLISVVLNESNGVRYLRIGQDFIYLNKIFYQLLNGKYILFNGNVNYDVDILDKILTEYENGNIYLNNSTENIIFVKNMPETKLTIASSFEVFYDWFDYLLQLDDPYSEIDKYINISSKPGIGKARKQNIDKAVRDIINSGKYDNELILRVVYSAIQKLSNGKYKYFIDNTYISENNGEYYAIIGDELTELSQLDEEIIQLFIQKASNVDQELGNSLNNYVLAKQELAAEGVGEGLITLPLNLQELLNNTISTIPDENKNNQNVQVVALIMNKAQITDDERNTLLLAVKELFKMKLIDIKQFASINKEFKNLTEC